jgi:uncharacterized membrane protein YkvA (DUF1232 family)
MDDKTPKDVTQYQKHYSDKGLLEKIGSTFKKAGLKVIYYVLLLYYVLHDENTPMQHKMIIIGALGYFILPFDLIPDFIPVAGFTDDVGALVACLKTVSDNVTPDIKAKAVNKLHDWFDNVEYEKVEEYDDDYTA